MKTCSECERQPFNPDVRTGSQCTAPGCSGVFVEPFLTSAQRRLIEDAIRLDDERRAG